MPSENFERWLLGDEPPFVYNSKASMLRVMTAVVKTNAKILGSYVSESTHGGKSWIIYSIELETGKKQEFEKIAGGTLSTPYELLGQELLGFNQVIN